MKKYFLLTSILLCSRVVFCQNVGVNTTTPEAALDINGDIILRSANLVVVDGITLALDVNTSRFSYYRIEGPTANFTLAGITAGIDGRLLTLFNRSGFVMQLNNDDAAVALSDRIITGTNADITIPNKGIVNLQYDGNEGKWIVKSSSKGAISGSGSFWDANGNNIFNNNTGNVGIGINTPSAPLHIKNENEAVRIEGSTPYISFHDNAGIRKGFLQSFNNDLYLGTPSTNTNGILQFYMKNSPAITLLPTGQVGIGTVTPTDKLTVHTGGYGLTHTNGNATIGTWIGSFQGVSTAMIGTKSNHPLSFFTNDGSELMTIATNGAVGIGNTTPAGKLHITHPGPSAHLILEYPGTNEYSRLLFANTGASRYWGIAAKAGTGSISNDRLSFYNISTGFESLVVTGNGYVSVPGQMGIGTFDPAYKFAVNGTIRSKEVVVETGWADYVFEESYQLPLLMDVEKFILQNKHLPNIPSADEIKKNGLQLGDTQTKMMEKIEELTLYLIEANKQIVSIQKEIEKLKSTNQ
ncbi:MAG: hypothetical protein WBC06_04225 [Chitinophagaceae bacterium]